MDSSAWRVRSLSGLRRYRQARAPSHAAERVEEPGIAATRWLERLTFLSDGVFAIALTLLVVSLTPPSGSDNVAAAIWDERVKVVSFCISFLVISVFWIGHMRAFSYLARVDGYFTWINLLFLGCIAFQPYPTAVLGTAGDSSAAVTLYASTLVLTGLAMLGIWLYAARARLYRADVDRRAVKHHTIRAGTTPLVFLLSIAIARVNPTWAELSWVGIAVAFGVLQRVYGG